MGRTETGNTTRRTGDMLLGKLKMKRGRQKNKGGWWGCIPIPGSVFGTP